MEWCRGEGYPDKWIGGLAEYGGEIFVLVLVVVVVIDPFFVSRSITNTMTTKGKRMKKRIIQLRTILLWSFGLSP